MAPFSLLRLLDSPIAHTLPILIRGGFLRLGMFSCVCLAAAHVVVCIIDCSTSFHLSTHPPIHSPLPSFSPPNLGPFTTSPWRPVVSLTTPWSVGAQLNTFSTNLVVSPPTPKGPALSVIPVIIINGTAGQIGTQPFKKNLFLFYSQLHNFIPAFRLPFLLSLPPSLLPPSLLRDSGENGEGKEPHFLFWELEPLSG